MIHLKFKDEVATRDQIRTLLGAARMFGVPIIKRKVSETEGVYSITYQSHGAEKTLVLKLSGDDNALMADCLHFAKRSHSDEPVSVAEGS